MVGATIFAPGSKNLSGVLNLNVTHRSAIKRSRSVVDPFTLMAWYCSSVIYNAKRGFNNPGALSLIVRLYLARVFCPSVASFALACQDHNCVTAYSWIIRSNRLRPVFLIFGYKRMPIFVYSEASSIFSTVICFMASAAHRVAVSLTSSSTIRRSNPAPVFLSKQA